MQCQNQTVWKNMKVFHGVFHGDLSGWRNSRIADELVIYLDLLRALGHSPKTLTTVPNHESLSGAFWNISLLGNMIGWQSVTFLSSAQYFCLLGWLRANVSISPISGLNMQCFSITIKKCSDVPMLILVHSIQLLSHQPFTGKSDVKCDN